MASSDVNPASPEASKSSCRRKACRSSNGSVSKRQNHCDEPLGTIPTRPPAPLSQYQRLRSLDHRDYCLPNPALPAVSVTALVPYHTHREPFDGERTVHQLELVGAVAY